MTTTLCQDYPVYPAIPPAKLQTYIKEQWLGGFLGEVRLAVQQPVQNWELKLTFPRRVFDLDVSIVIIYNDIGRLRRTNAKANGTLRKNNHHS